MPIQIRALSALLLSSALACGSSPNANPDAGQHDSGPVVPADVTIKRDLYGIPHISSDTDTGAMYGAGYASAQDRLLQMTLMTLGIQGRLSEFIGRVPIGNTNSVEIDRKNRAFGYWRHAQKVVDNLPSDTRELLDAYADGVNQYLRDVLASEHLLMSELGIPAQEWTAAHCIGVWYWIGQFFAPDGLKQAKELHDFEAEVLENGLNAVIESRLCDQPSGDSAAGIVQADDIPKSKRDAIFAYAESVGQTPFACPNEMIVPNVPMSFAHVSPKFSHAWAVGGSQTSMGSAILISDPQTPVSFPAIWHEIAVSGETIRARGATIPGSPGIIIGWNDEIAWGVTAAGYSQTDLFRIEMDERANDSYILDGAPASMLVETETIQVKGEAAQTLEYRETVFGPLVTEFVADAAGEEFAARKIPLADGDTDSAVAFFGMMRSTNFDEFNLALDDFRFPPVNMVAGDRSGNIMFRLLGAVPVRSTLAPLGGAIAQEGKSMDNMWQGTIPGEFMPQVVNPAQGYLYSANHRAAGAWYPLAIGLGTGGIGDTSRSARLRELLSELPDNVSADLMYESMQNDCVEVGRRDIVAMGAHLASMEMLSLDATRTVSALENWAANGSSLTINSDTAYLASQINTNFRLSETGPELLANYGGGGNGYMFFVKTMRAAIAANASFLPTAAEIRFIELLLADAWTAANAIERSQWSATYESQATVTVDHFALLGLPPLGSSQSEPVPLQCVYPGTIWSQGQQSYTQLVDLANVDSSSAMIPPGNSEILTSNTAQGQTSLWASGQLRSAPLSDSAIDDIAVSTLVLTPNYR